MRRNSAGGSLTRRVAFGRRVEDTAGGCGVAGFFDSRIRALAGFGRAAWGPGTFLTAPWCEIKTALRPEYIRNSNLLSSTTLIAYFFFFFKFFFFSSFDACFLDLSSLFHSTLSFNLTISQNSQPWR